MISILYLSHLLVDNSSFFEVAKNAFIGRLVETIIERWKGYRFDYVVLSESVTANATEEEFSVAADFLRSLYNKVGRRTLSWRAWIPRNCGTRSK
jgi:hypothetical protein